MEIVPNSSGESSTCDEEMSQEFPPPEGSKSRPPRKEAPSFSSIMQDQRNLNSYLSTLSKPSPAEVNEAKKKAAILEENLKMANLGNQAERKKLAAAHSTLLSQCLSQEELSQGSQPLKAQLLQLATRQKQLLESFKKQKEINSTLIELEEMAKQFAVECNNPSQMKLSNVDISKVDSEASRNSLRGSVVLNPSTLAAALPNLVRHLRQPVGHGERAPQPSQPAVVVSASCTSQMAATNTRSLFASFSSSSLLPCPTRPSHVQHALPQSLPPCSQTLAGSKLVVSGGQVPSLAHQQLSSSEGGVTTAKVSSTDLSQPVPLPNLIKHGFIRAGVDCISCVIMGCEFKASLLEDGSIKDHVGAEHQIPQQWVRSCWAKLGHAQKKPSKKSTYTSVLYLGTPLLQFCEKYSLKQVNSYLIEKDKRKSLTQPTTDHHVASHSSSCDQENDGIPQNTTHASATLTDTLSTSTNSHCTVTSNPSISVNVSGSLNCTVFRVDDLKLLLHGSSKQTSLELPYSFWRSDEKEVWSETLCQQIEEDLQW